MAAGAWYHGAVTWAAESGIVNGIDIGVYAPGRAITRQEMAVMLLNYANYKGYGVPQYRIVPAFADYHQIDDWAEGATRALAEVGVINGSNNEFMPKKNATRAEVAQLFSNFMRFTDRP